MSICSLAVLAVITHAHTPVRCVWVCRRRPSSEETRKIHWSRWSGVGEQCWIWCGAAIHSEALTHKRTPLTAEGGKFMHKYHSQSISNQLISEAEKNKRRWQHMHTELLWQIANCVRIDSDDEFSSFVLGQLHCFIRWQNHTLTVSTSTFHTCTNQYRAYRIANKPSNCSKSDCVPKTNENALASFAHWKLD